MNKGRSYGSKTEFRNGKLAGNLNVLAVMLKRQGLSGPGENRR